MPSIPGSIALTNIADGASIVAADHRNNYAAVQTAVNGLITAVNVTAKGDLLVGTGSGAIVNLAVGTNGQVLVADSTQTAGVKWGPANGLYRKTTAKDVVNTVTETDLLNSEITIGASVMGTTGAVRVTLLGDLLQNSGGDFGSRWRVKFGGTTLLDVDHNVAGPLYAASANRRPWWMQFTIENLSSASSQFMAGSWLLGPASTSGIATGIGGGGQSPAASSGTLGTTGSMQYPFATSGTVAVNTANACALQVTVQNQNANASYSVRLQSALVEVI